MTHPLHQARISLVVLLLSTLTACAPAYYPATPVNGWNNEDAYWQNNYLNEPYYVAGYGYETYQPAYLYGVESYHRYNGRRFEELNRGELRHGWEQSHGRGSRLDWQHARAATHAAYNRMAQNDHAAPARSESGGGRHDDRDRR